jgi:hypothetical protein
VDRADRARVEVDAVGRHEPGPADQVSALDRLERHRAALRDKDLERDPPEPHDVEAVRRVPLAHQVGAVLERDVLGAAGDQAQVLLGHAVECLRLGEELLNGLH